MVCVVCMYTSLTTGNPLSIPSPLIVKRSVCLCNSALFEQYAVGNLLYHLSHFIHFVHCRCRYKGEEPKWGNSSDVCLF